MGLSSSKIGCKDCGSITRKLTSPGPRCRSCHSAKKKERSLDAHGKRVLANYNITPTEYWALYDAQGGMCYMCGPWTNNRGISKRLSVDHDHACCPAPPTCGRCTRGLLCSRCNSVLGELGDSSGHIEDRLFRMLDYIKQPPAQNLLLEIREKIKNDS